MLSACKHCIHAKTLLLVQEQYLLRASVREPVSSKQVIIKSASRSRKGKGKQTPSKQLPDTLPAEEAGESQTAVPLTAAQRAKFAERLQDAQRIEDLFEACAVSVLTHTCTGSRSLS